MARWPPPAARSNAVQPCASAASTGQAEVEQATHRIGVADDRGGRHVAGLQRAPGQRPAAPVEPVGEIAAARRPAPRRAASGHRRRACPAMAPCAISVFNAGFAAERGGQVQRGHAVAVAGIEIDAVREQPLDHAHPAQAHRERQRRIAGGRGAQRIGAAFEQFQRELFQAASGLVAVRAGGEEARQAAAAGRRHRVPQQRLQRRQARPGPARATRTSPCRPCLRARRHRRPAPAASRCARPTAARPDRAAGRRSSAGDQQLAAGRDRVRRAALAQAVAQQGQRRAIRRRHVDASSSSATADGSAIGGIERGDQRPAPGRGGVVDRALAVAVGGVADRRPARAGAAPAPATARRRVQASISALRPSASVARDVGTRAASQRARSAARLPPRAASSTGVRPCGVARLHVGAGGEQRGDDLGVPGDARLRAMRCGRRASRASTLALCLSSSCTPATSSSSPPAAASSAGVAAPSRVRAWRRVRAGNAPAASCRRRRRCRAA